MKIKNCRSCQNNSLEYLYSLGSQYFTGIFPSTKNEKIPKGNLSMVLCKKCKLLQLQDSFDVNVMYGENYGYLSSLNLHMVKHLQIKSQKLKKISNLTLIINSNQTSHIQEAQISVLHCICEYLD